MSQLVERPIFMSGRVSGTSLTPPSRSVMKSRGRVADAGWTRLSASLGRRKTVTSSLGAVARGTEGVLSARGLPPLGAGAFATGAAA